MHKKSFNIFGELILRANSKLSGDRSLDKAKELLIEKQNKEIRRNREYLHSVFSVCFWVDKSLLSDLI